MVGLNMTVDGMEDVAVRLDRWRGGVPRAAHILDAMAVTTRRRTFGRTFKERGLNGARWADLTPRYEAWKNYVRPGEPILRFDGTLEASMTSPRGGVFRVTSKGFEVGTDVPYARAHQDGTDRMVARPIIGPMPQADRRELVKLLQQHMLAEVGR